eukprot:scaffold258030_cov28-Tisochrysis_lutea.AAC.2
MSRAKERQRAVLAPAVGAEKKRGVRLVPLPHLFLNMRCATQRWGWANHVSGAVSVDVRPFIPSATVESWRAVTHMPWNVPFIEYARREPATSHP